MWCVIYYAFRLFHPWNLDSIWSTVLLNWFLAASYLHLRSSTVDRWVPHTLEVFCQAVLLTLRWTQLIEWNLHHLVMSISLVIVRFMHLPQHCSQFLPSLTLVLGIRIHQLTQQNVSLPYWLLVQVIIGTVFKSCMGCVIQKIISWYRMWFYHDIVSLICMVLCGGFMATGQVMPHRLWLQQPCMEYVYNGLIKRD